MRMRVFLALVMLVSVGFGLVIVVSYVDEALYWRGESPRRYQRAAERLAAAIASRQADSGTVITSMSALSGPGCAGLGVCFRDEHEAFEYERHERVRFENVDGGRVVCVNEACAPIDRGEAPVSQCALLKKFEERCGAQLAAGCGEPSGEHFFLGYAAHLKRPMFSKELHCGDGLVGLPAEGSPSAPRIVRYVELDQRSDGSYQFQISLAGNPAKAPANVIVTDGGTVCVGYVRPTASGWRDAAP